MQTNIYLLMSLLYYVWEHHFDLRRRYMLTVNNNTLMLIVLEHQ